MKPGAPVDASTIDAERAPRRGIAETSGSSVGCAVVDYTGYSSVTA